MPAGKKTARSLTGGDAFQAVYKAGRRYASAVATIYVLEQPGSEVRLGIPAGRRLGTAVRRNRVRRRFRQAFSHVSLALNRGAHVVIVPRNEALTAPFAVLVAALENAASRAGLTTGSGGDGGAGGREQDSIA